MAQELLMEIGVEEIPSAYMPGTLAELENLAAKKLGEARLTFGQLKVWGTPRRLVLYVQDLKERQPDALIENRGPKKAIAFDKNGQPAKPGLGFARSQNMDFDDLEIRNVGGVEYVFAVKKEPGSPTAQILPDLLTNIIKSISFPKSMRWGYYHTRFARPIRWLLAMYGNENIEISIENVKSANFTYGHRFLAPGALIVKDIPDYFRILKEHYVVLDQNERREMIWRQVQAAAAAAGGKPVDNKELLEEVNYLLEYPTAFYGEFSPAYLKVPPEVLTTTMIANQRYFPVFDENDNLLPGFIGVRNGTDYCLDVVKAGNERVLKARLEDALFFWNEDIKKPLSTMALNLKDILFHERLGSVMDKTARLQKLAVFIGRENGLSDDDTLDRAAYLCKADLPSNMVYEFPELQGVMGRYYAIHSGESFEVGQAIFEHYLPRFAGDNLPATPAGIALSLAEKIDNLVGCFSIGIKPTGSQDPYALRRQALGIVNIILEANLTIDLKVLIARAYVGFVSINPDNSQEVTVNEVADFIRQRLRGILLERGIPYDVVDAVLAIPSADLNDIVLRCKVLEAFKVSPEFEDFMVVYNRSHNLSRKWESAEVEVSFLVDESERTLYTRYLEVREEVNQAIQDQDYNQALQVLAGMRKLVDQFFEAVMVMVEDENLKAARLGMLKAITVLCHTVADFSKV